MIDVNLHSIHDYFSQKNIKCSLKEKFLAISLDPIPVCLYIVNIEKLEASFIQFRYFFPTKFIPEATCDLARYLLRVNQGLQFQGFGLIEADQIVYYRHDIYCYRKRIDSQILDGVLGNILLFIDNYGENIQDLSLRKKTFEEIAGKEN